MNDREKRKYLQRYPLYRDLWLDNLNQNFDPINDAVYNTATGILRSPMGSTTRDIGNSVQISNIIKPTFQWEFNVTYDFWVRGKFFNETQNTAALTQYYLMLSAQYSF